MHKFELMQNKYAPHLPQTQILIPVDKHLYLYFLIYFLLC